jgi:hypothetical protein
MTPPRPLIRGLVLALLAASCAPARADEVDRLLAAVNGRVITRRDLTLAANLNALMVFGRSEQSPNQEGELDRLIDLEILSQELRNSAGIRVEPSRVEGAIRDLENAYTEIGGLTGLLARLGLERGELVEYVTLQASVAAFIDSRFRPFVSVTAEEQEAFYRGQLMPELQRAGAKVPPLAEVAQEVTRVLTEEKVTAALVSWLKDVRRHSRIELFTGPAFPGEEVP